MSETKKGREALGGEGHLVLRGKQGREALGGEGHLVTLGRT